MKMCVGTLKGCRSALGCLQVTAFILSTGDVVDVYQREFMALRDRLHAAEQESLKRSKELNLVLDEIKRAMSERQALRDTDGNRTWGRLTGERQAELRRGSGADRRLRCLTRPFPTCPEDPRLKPWNGSHKHVLRLPTVFHHLPHLLAKESSLQPAVRVSQGRTGGRGGAGRGRCRGGAGRRPAQYRPSASCSVGGDGHPQRSARSALVPDGHAALAHLRAEPAGEGGLGHRGADRRGECAGTRCGGGGDIQRGSHSTK